jgi:hypothetical protein
MLAISAFAVFVALSSAQTSTISDAVQLSEHVYKELKAADEAGANITAVAEEYNAALGLIDQAERLESSGNHTGATSLVSQAVNTLQTIPPEAEKLRTDALSQQETTRRVKMAAIPIGAFAFALAVTAFLVIRRRVKFKQISEMKVVAK